MNYHHNSVLLNEAIQALNINESGIYIDGTFGVGGHSKLILSKLNRNGRLLAIDKDCLSVKIGKTIFKEDDRFHIVHGSFANIKQYVKNIGCIGLVNGILLDLGVSSLQLDDVSRGFSFMRDGLLDMRMDISTGQSAAQWISTASEREIGWVLKSFGEEKFYKKISKNIVRMRKKQSILSSYFLSKIVSASVYNYCSTYNKYRHPATKSFLAIRMYINNELNDIIKLLQSSLEVLSPLGRLVIISFNSLEDRLVKDFIFKNSNITHFVPFKLPMTNDQMINTYCYKYRFKKLGRLMPSDQEIKKNIRARSAILRYAEKSIIL